MPQPSGRLINLFGAVALGVADQVRWLALDETGLGGEAAAALIIIGHVPGLSIDQLRRVLRLSQPGTVRLVDRLVAAGLATRAAAPHDRRAVALTLTKAGRADRKTLLERRRRVLGAILKEVTSADRTVLERVAGTILRALPEDAASALTVCRFCDEHQCPDCPMDAFGALE